MDAPYYTATVTSLTAGWSYTATHEEVPDPGEPVHLGHTLSYRWGFSDDLVPGQLLPTVASVVLYAQTADDVPDVQIGDQITLDVRVGVAGPRIIQPPPMRVTSATVEIDLDQAYVAEVKVTAVDTLVDLPGMFPAVLGDNFGPPGSGLEYDDIRGARRAWRPRLAEIANRIGRTIGCPTWWSDTEHPNPGTGAAGWAEGLERALVRRGGWNGRSARDLLTQLLNSHQPSGVTHSVAPGYSSNPATFPAGWQRVGPVAGASWSDSGEPSVAEPATSHRYYLVPASRTVVAGATPWPGRLAVVDGLLTITAQPTTGDTNVRVGLDARWCEIPTTARRAREHIINTIKQTGEIRVQQPSAFVDYQPGELQHVDAASVAAVGPSGRETPTALNLIPQGALTPLAPAIAAARFFSDASVLAAPWAYDEVKVTSSEIPQADATALLPRIAPRFPGETDGDGLVLRHVTLYALASEARFGNGDPMTGFVAAGQLAIADGELTWTLECTPGLPQWSGAAPTPVTVGQVDAASYQAQPIELIDPRIRIADLAYVSA